MVDIGIIGLARSGKTSLFNAMTRGTAAVGAFSSKNEPNVGVVRVPDARVDALAQLRGDGPSIERDRLAGMRRQHQ